VRAYIVTLAVVAMLVSMPYASALVYEWEEWIGVYADDDLDADLEWNCSASNASDFTNYNQTILPFINSTNITGTFTGSYTPPIVASLDNTSTRFDETWIGTLCEFKSDWIMSGSSISWWRVPALNITNFTFIYMFIWRVGVPAALDPYYNSTTQIFTPNYGSQPSMVFIQGYDPSVGENQTYIHHNVTAWNQSLNTTWLRVDAPIHSDTDYYVSWNITTPSNSDPLYQRLLMSQGDVGDNGIYKTFTYQDGTATDLDCDPDISVMHQYGMGHTVTGWNVTYGSGGGGGGSSYPSDEDAMHESLSPTGTCDGGQWDGDWVAGARATAALDSGTVHEGTYSIKITTSGTGGGAYYDYKLDSAFDISSMETVNYWVYPADPAMCTVKIYLMNQAYPGSGGGVHYTFSGGSALTEDTWNHIELPCNDWAADGWTEYGSFDETDFDHFRIYYSNNYQVGDISYEDNMYFNVSGGGGGSNPQYKFYSHIDDGPDDTSDYLTFFMPFIQDIDDDNAVSVRIQSWNYTYDYTYWQDDSVPIDFILNSTAWPYNWECNDFYITLSFENDTNAFFLHDQNSEFDRTYEDPALGAGLDLKFNVMWVYADGRLPDGTLVWFRPFHALQVTDGAWVNTQVDPVYFLDGRFVEPGGFKMREESHSFPILWNVLRGAAIITFVTYTVFDKIVFLDHLPDWDIDPDYSYTSPGVQWLVNGGRKLWAGLCWFKEKVDMLVEYGGMLLTFIVKAVALFIAMLIFINLIIILNSVKRFFVVWAADGPLVGGQYAEHLVGNAYKSGGRFVTFTAGKARWIGGRYGLVRNPRVQARRYGQKFASAPRRGYQRGRRWVRRKWRAGRQRWRRA
jgi:hypothetical protein